MRDALLRIYASTLDQANQLVADVPDERFADQPFQGAKHPAWVLGHLALASGMMVDHLRGQPGGFGGVPEAWADLSMPGAECRPERAVYPSKADLLAHLNRIHDEAASAFKAATDDTLNAPFPIEEWREFFPRQIDACVYLLAHHEGYHLGQLTQWRRAAGFHAVVTG